MTNIYDLHDKAFSSVSAYVICKNNERVATLAFKFPKDGAGRLWCYFHYLSEPMVRGYAGGYGYDKKSAAVCNAVGKLALEPENPDFASQLWYILTQKAKQEAIDSLKIAFANIGGKDWQDALRDLGYHVLGAV